MGENGAASVAIAVVRRDEMMTLFMLRTSMAINTPPLVLLNTHVNTTAQATINTGSERWI
jgi:hypothetical protein